MASTANAPDDRSIQEKGAMNEYNAFYLDDSKPEQIFVKAFANLEDVPGCVKSAGFVISLISNKFYIWQSNKWVATFDFTPYLYKLPWRKA